MTEDEPKFGQRAFGRGLRSLRERLNFSQRELGLHFGLDASMIGKMEAGSRKPPLSPGFYDPFEVEALGENIERTIGLSVHAYMKAKGKLPETPTQ